MRSKSILFNKFNLLKSCLYVFTIIAIGNGTLILTFPQTALQKPLSPISSFLTLNSIRQKYVLKEKDSSNESLKEPSQLSLVILGLLTFPILNSHWETFFNEEKPFHYIFLSVLPLFRSHPICF
jgi:hypothetical protein